MEIEYIREFITLAQLENYMAAAEELYISQPSLSKHIKSLENELGVPLFDRTTRRVKLNHFGQAFLPYARRITEANSEFRTSLSKLVRDVDNVVHLGVLPSFIAYGIQDHVTGFRQRYPDYLITLVDGTNDDLLHALMDGRCNLVFVRHFGEISASQFVSLPYVRDQLCLIIPQGHPLADGRTTVRAEELRNLKLMTSTSATMAQILSDFSTKSGIQLNITAQLGRSNSIIAMVKKDFGAALLMQAPSSRGRTDGIAVLPIEPAVVNTVSLVYAKDKPLSRAARSFIQTVFPNGAKGDERHG